MKIALLAPDSKIPNLALMKLSAWLKAQGDEVEVYMPIFKSEYDRLYISKVFNFSPEPEYLPECEIIRGGTGYDLKTELPAEAEYIYPDYEMFRCNYAIGFTSRGCIRKCSFCLVPQKEGSIRAVGDIYNFWNGQKELMLLDNNLTALPEHFEKILKQTIREKMRVDFNQGLDIRLLTGDMAQLLAKVRLWKQIHFAWDSMNYEKAVIRGIEVIKKYMPLSRIMFYVLIGFDTTPEEDLYRVETLRGLKVDPFVMPFNKHDLYQKRFARWVNHKAIFKSVEWKNYKPEKHEAMNTFLILP